jgi:hypothetical protein
MPRGGGVISVYHRDDQSIALLSSLRQFRYYPVDGAATP